MKTALEMTSEVERDRRATNMSCEDGVCREFKAEQMPKSSTGEFREMLCPDPANLFGRVVLVLGEPQLPFLCDDVENFTFRVSQVGIAGFTAGFVDIEFIQTCCEEQDFWISIDCSRGWVCRCIGMIMGMGMGMSGGILHGRV